MQILDQAVAAMQAGKGRVDGAKVAAKLEALAAIGDRAARIWQDYLDKPGAPGDKYALVTWVGPERSRQLHELSLEAHALVNEVCAAAGDQARFLVLDESPIALAYRGLKPGETGPQSAQAALAEQQATNKHVRELADKVRGLKASAAKAKPAAKKAAKPVRKAAPKKKPAAKKAAKKPAKKAAKKAPKKK